MKELKNDVRFVHFIVGILAVGIVSVGVSLLALALISL